jgi:transcriptional regulator with XRE-family HTH domain
MNPIEFGRKISELRKVKGLTQAELAEKCRINIRSIQRIESGRVIPRSYTVNVLSKALDHDLTIPETDRLNGLKKISKKLIDMIPGSSQHKKYGAKDMEKKLKTAWIAGIIMFAVMIPEAILNILRYYDSLSSTEIPVYIIISILSAVSYVIFVYGFILIGVNLNNNLITICSYLFIFCTIVEYGYDIFSIGNNPEEQKFIGAILSVIYGFIGIFFGVGLFRIENIFGDSAKYAGILNIIAGVTFVLVVLFFIGLVLLIPITILEILILYKAASKLDWIPEKTAFA